MRFGRRNRVVARAGFTLIELLVVISIIGMLMALLFPAINAARESGRETTCRNNMRSVAQALFSFEAKKNHFPSFINGEMPFPNGNPLMHELFPEMDRQDLYRAFNNQYVGVDTTNGSYPRASLEFLQCPSNRRTEVSANCFVFNAGTFGRINANDRVEIEDGTHSSWFAQALPQEALERQLGMFHLRDAITGADLTNGDGSTNTAMVSENLLAGKWGEKRESLIGFTWQLPNPDSSDNLHGINLMKTFGGRAPTSNHRQLVNAAFADTHVRTLSEAMDYFVYIQLCTPNGAAISLHPLREDY